MRKLNSQFITTFVSEAGLSGQNGTYYGFVEMDRYYCMAVAEGFDGDGGQESAKLAVDTAIEAFVQKPGIKAGRIRACIRKAHKRLMQQSVRIRLKAGILLLVSDYTRFRYGVCGNVMLFAMRNAGIYHQSITHTRYQAMMDQKQIPETENAAKKETGNLYHYLGGNARVTVSGKIKMEDGDLLLAVTEGVWSRVGRVEILDAYESIQSVGEFLGDLQELYVRGSTEGIPCCCLAAVEIKKTYQENRALKKKIMIWCLIIVLILAVVGTVAVLYIRHRRRRQQEIRNTTAVYEDTGDQYLTDFNALLAKQEYEKAAEENQKLDKSGERLEKEQLLSTKITVSVILEEADQAYDGRAYEQARDAYKKAQELAKQYSELLPLVSRIDQQLKLAGTGMEIDTCMQNGALKEAEGDIRTAASLYRQAEAMLRIVDDPERLKEAQLALLRVNGLAEQEEKEERARDRDVLIAEADEEAAVDAILAGDMEAALEQYTKIRDAYIGMEENEKAEEITQIMLSLQKQSRAAREVSRESIEVDKSAAFEAVLAGDLETALSLYAKVEEACLQIEDTAGAEEAASLIASLEAQTVPAAEGDAAGPEEVQTIPQAVPEVLPEGAAEEAPPEEEAGEEEAVSPEERLALEQMVTPILEQALRETANQEFEAAIEAYRRIAELYTQIGDPVTADRMEMMARGLEKLQKDASSGGNGNG